jgi:hypothetical protein
MEKSYSELKLNFRANLIKRMHFLEEEYATTDNEFYKTVVGYEIEDILKLIKILKKY